MTPNQVNLLVAMAKALEDLLAGARDKRSALAMFRRRVEDEAKEERMAGVRAAEIFAGLDEFMRQNPPLPQGVHGLVDTLEGASDFYDVPQAELDAEPNIYKGTGAAPGWTYEL